MIDTETTTPTTQVMQTLPTTGVTQPTPTTEVREPARKQNDKGLKEMRRWDFAKGYQTAKVLLKEFQKKFPAESKPTETISLDQMLGEAELIK